MGAFPCGVGIDLVDSGSVDRFRRPRHSLWCVSGIRGVVALDLACVLAAIDMLESLLMFCLLSIASEVILAYIILHLKLSTFFVLKLVLKVYLSKLHNFC